MPGTPSAKRWLFDAWSHFYDLEFIQRLTYRPVHDAVVAALRERPPRRLLDLGCGTGLLAIRLRREMPGTALVGCDYSIGMLRQARARLPDAPWVQGDAGRLPFRDGAFDAIVSTEAFHWFPDQAAALAECRRLVVPGGRLLAALVNPPLEAMSRVVRVGSGLVGQPFYWPTRARMRDLLEAARFRVDAQRRIVRLPGGVLLPPVLTVATRV
ncbi:MAG: methyltransferase domain-containing protein [Candidatus Binatia bacterium]